MNAIDRIISAVSPTLALRRERSRAAIAALRTYDGATRGRAGSGFTNRTTTHNNDIGAALDILRTRSRNMAQNNEWGARAVQAIRNNTVGDGIRLRLNGVKGPQAKSMLAAWRNWADSTEVDFGRQMTLYGMQALAVETMVKSGDCLIIRRRTPRRIPGIKATNAMPFSLQILDGQHLDIQKNSLRTTTDGSITRYGVEFGPLVNGSREITGYWILSELPGENTYIRGGQSEFFKAEDVCHIYRIESPGQIRGVPWMSCGILGLNDLGEFQSATLLQRKVAACFSAFVHDFNGDGFDPANAGDSPLSERIEPGMIEYLPSGKTISFANPPTNSDFGGFAGYYVRKFAAAMGVSYESISMDYSQVNFSSGRMGWIEMHKNITDWQWNIVIPMFMSKVFNWWKESADQAGIISGRQSEAYPSWTAPRREMLDPVKEVQGMSDAIGAGLISYPDAVRGEGYDIEEIAEENKEALAVIKASGMEFSWMTPKQPKPKKPEPPPEE